MAKRVPCATSQEVMPGYKVQWGWGVTELGAQGIIVSGVRGFSARLSVLARPGFRVSGF